MEIHIELDHSCPLKCLHCSSNATNLGEDTAMDASLIIDFLKKNANDKKVYFTGGEPLLYSEINNLFNKISQNVPNTDIGLFSTGLVLMDKNIVSIDSNALKIFYKEGLTSCYISMYSAYETIHDYITGVPGSLKKTISAIRNMISEGITVNLNVVVHKMNYQYLNEIVEYAKKLEISEIRFLKLIKQGRAMFSWDKLSITDSEYRNAVSPYLTHDNDIRITASGKIDLFPCRSWDDECICQAGRKLLYITYTGDIFPCACVKGNNNFKIASVYDEYAWEKIQQWNSNHFHEKFC